LLEAVGAIYAGVDVIRKGLSPFRLAAEVLLRHREELEGRGFVPPDVLRLASRRRWKTTDLARALDVSVEEVVALLEGFGFEKSDGTWHAPLDLPRQVGVVLLNALTGYEAAMHDADAVVERCRRELARIIDETDQG
jgi:hypothetical protein